MTIYCYETKEKFSSINKAAKKYDVGASDIIKVLDNPNRTSASYHWCTDLAIFDNVKLTYNKTPVSQVVYCYETKEKFNNVTEAARKYNAPSRVIRKILDNPNRTSGNYHWCTDLAIFDGIYLSDPRTREVIVYCYETKEKFNSIKEAQAKYNTESISIAINKPHKTAAEYHWCTDLAIFDEIKDELSIGQNYKKTIYCYETKELFNSISEAKIKYRLSTDIGKVLNDPNKTAGGYHWCTDLSIFDGVELSIGQTYKKVIYCYETKEQFDSIAEAQAKYNISGINCILDDPNRTAGNFHWCTDLTIFDEIKLNSSNKIPIYCYETKERFDSITEAQIKYNVGNIGQILNNPNKSAGGYHWCTDLAIFDEIEDELIISQNYKKSIYCYETKEKFDSINQAQIKYNVGNIGQILNNPTRTAGDYHWCTDLAIFDVVKLSSGYDLIRIPVYCYETKEQFESIAEAQKKYNIGGINQILNDPNKSAAGYHWCTDLSIFDKSDLNIGKSKLIFCYETKEQFESITEAAKKFGAAYGSTIGQVLDNPTRTAYAYHWCTDLSLFNPDDLVYPECGTSNQEKEIVDIIKSIYNKEIITNSRSIISPYELDIYLPELNLAFEFNGDYWHSEQAGKHKNYHINKTNLCKAKGIQLIHIFEYQYRENPTIIKSMIMNKLKYNPIRLYARNCEIRQVSNLETKNFLNDNHIQGFVTSSINIGLYCNDVLVSVMTFGKSRFDKSIEYELLRYACLRSTNVIGGASKLLKYFEKTYKPKSLISYADISYSNGNLYNKLGFNYISTSDPDYVNIKNNIVYSRYQTMKHKLPELLGEENFDIKLTEQQNLDNNGFLRIWKCGNLKYLKEYNN